MKSVIRDGWDPAIDRYIRDLHSELDKCIYTPGTRMFYGGNVQMGKTEEKKEKLT